MGKLEQLDFLPPSPFFLSQFLLACFGPEDESTLEAVGSVISGSSNPQRQACSALDSRSKVAEEGSDVLPPLVVALDDVLHLQGSERAAEGEGDGARDTEHYKRWPASRLGWTSVRRDAGSLQLIWKRGEFEVLMDSLRGSNR